MATGDGAVRPNIRIEIQNNVQDDSMQVDENDDTLNLNSEEEDGEISDEMERTAEPVVSNTQKITYPGMTSGTRQRSDADGPVGDLNACEKDVQEKLMVRAERFGIAPDESQAMTDVQLQELHDTLGITNDNEKNVRFDAVHMHGTDEMSTQDVFSYFETYAPISIEWVNDASCNVVWADKVSPARALYRLSQSVRGMPVEGPCDPFKNEHNNDMDTTTDDKEKGRSILLVVNDRDIRFAEDDNENNKENSNGVHVSDITIPIPPGYWRLGKSQPKTKYILLRFAHKTDRKPLRAERFSQYYKKYGNPNYGGLKGIITESKKKQMKGIFDRYEIVTNKAEDAEAVSGNPWGSLAKNWNRDHRQEKDPAEYITEPVAPTKATGIQQRLGHKRAASSDSDDSAKNDTKKSKVPRMRMYADEEEEKIKRKKAVQRMTKTYVASETDKPDLRSKLNLVEKGQQRSNVLETRSRINRELIEGLRVHQRRDHDVGERYVPSTQEELHYSENEEDDDLKYQQKSKVTVIIKKQRKPAVASTVWSRMNDGKGKRRDDSSSENSSEEDEESSDCKDPKELYKKSLLNRPGFSSGDLKSRLGVKSTDHKSPLRIEINNDLFKTKSTK